MPDTPKTVTLPTNPRGPRLDLAKLNAAMDAIIDQGSEAAGRYLLVHTHRWPGTEAVEYSRAAQDCIDNGIDPNRLDDQPEAGVTK